MSTDQPEFPPLPEVTPLVTNKAAIDRLTMAISIHHESMGMQPNSRQCIGQTLLSECDEPYSRQIKGGLNQAWQPINLGHFTGVEEVGYVLIENLEGKHLQVNPTAEERAEINQRIIEVGYGTNDPLGFKLLVLPGFCLPVLTELAYLLKLRSKHGIAACRVTIYPR